MPHWEINGPDDVRGLVVIVVVVIVAAIALVWRFGGISVSKEGVNVGKVRRATKKKPPLDAADIMSLVARTAQLGELKAEWREKISDKRRESRLELIEMQLRHWEDREAELTGMILRSFADMLSKKGETDAANHPDFFSMRSATGMVGTSVKNIFRSAMQKNHLLDYSPEQWAVYREKFYQSVLTTAMEAYNLYYRGTLVTRDALYKRNNQPDILKFASDGVLGSLEYAREATRKWHDEIVAMETQAGSEIGAAEKAHERWLRDHVIGKESA